MGAEGINVEGALPNSDVIPIETTKRLLQKIDRRILPLMCIVYGLAHVDKIAMGFTLLFGFREDLNVSAYQYNWCLAIFFVGYLVAAYPSTLMLQRFPTVKVVSLCVMCWGVLLLGMLGIKNFEHLIIVRLFLGIAEAAVTPGLIMYTSKWYTRHEQVYRTMLWGAMQTGFAIMGALSSYGLLHIDNTSLQRWRYPFLLLGILSFFAGLGWLLLMPESPATATFLDPTEREIASKRAAENMMLSERTAWKGYQISEAMKDIKIWLLFISVFFAQLAGNAIVAFSSPIIASFGFDRYTALLITIPAWVISIVTIIGYGFISRKFLNGRTIAMMFPTIIAVIATAIMFANIGPLQKVKWGKVVALWFTGFTAMLWPAALTIVGQNIAGETKKGFTNTLVLVAYATSNIAAPFISGNQNAAGLRRLLGMVMASYSIAFVASGLLRAYMQFKNGQRDKKYGPVETEVQKIDGMRMGLEDKTDGENKSFRYLL